MVTVRLQKISSNPEATSVGIMQYEKCLDMIYTVSTCSWCFLSDNFSAFVDFVSHNTRFLMTIVLFSTLIYMIMSPVGKCTARSNANSYLIW